eukprot:TRINITY_DN4186_c0_g2_i3.p1 TRINITY_DN4186_c0_g2~~TRINITY_DN4186_c0_g2_i3.p1  ORF type:complete len:116 (-),score=6.79 TRINITY_DN4186_c0_g2_i3:48-395(-)
MADLREDTLVLDDGAMCVDVHVRGPLHEHDGEEHEHHHHHHHHHHPYSTDDIGSEHALDVDDEGGLGGKPGDNGKSGTRDWENSPQNCPCLYTTALSNHNRETITLPWHTFSILY